MDRHHFLVPERPLVSLTHRARSVKGGKAVGRTRLRAEAGGARSSSKPVAHECVLPGDLAFPSDVHLLRQPTLAPLALQPFHSTSCDLSLSSATLSHALSTKHPAPLVFTSTRLQRETLPVLVAACKVRPSSQPDPFLLLPASCTSSCLLLPHPSTPSRDACRHSSSSRPRSRD